MTIGNILGGALGGAGLGSAFGPIGTAAGGILGGLGGLFGDRPGVLQQPEQLRQFDLYTPEQQAILSQLAGALTGQGEQPTGGILGNLMGERGLNAFREPALRTYFEEIVPGIAERFTGANAQRSSAFQQALARSGENLSTRLGELRSQQQQQLLSSLLGTVLQPRTAQTLQPGGATALGNLLRGIAPSLGRAAGTGLGQRLAGNIFG